VSEGVPRLREVVKEAEQRRRGGRGTLVFVDEIHRLNKGQQDFLLPFIESGLLTLIGATTEHPGFEINPGRAFPLPRAGAGAAAAGGRARRAAPGAGGRERGLGELGTRLDDEAEEALVRATGGDARQALTALEIAARLAGPRRDAHRGDGARGVAAAHRPVRPHAGVRDAFRLPQVAPLVLRRGGAVLGDADGARRRGPQDALPADDRHGLRGRGARRPAGRRGRGAGDARFERLGAPEGYLPMANAILYLAQAPKSNRAYMALHAATEAAAQHPDAPVPLALRKRHHRADEGVGYGKDYQYATATRAPSSTSSASPT
jgi:putative ATPase